ncbi:MAG: DUF364 domain-containing protein [Deltaproteobacteria bacterium]|nr:DUF364 domain-containing protein [Deltaproteobacteria bacterium]
MDILGDLISKVNDDAEVHDIRVGMFHTGVLTRNCGLAASLPRDVLKVKGQHVQDPGFLMERQVKDLVRMVYSGSILEAAVGMATLNSLLDIEEERCLELNAGDILAEKGNGRRIAIVGHFPFIPKLQEIAKDLWVIEKNPKENDFPEEAAEKFIPMADVIGITGTSITNHSIENLLRLCGSQAFVVVLGDSTPLSKVLFDHGIDAISGVKVVDSELALKCVSQGANFRQIKGIKKLTMMR